MAYFKVISSKRKSIYEIVFEFIYSFKISLIFFVRDFQVMYRQSIIGPLWHIINPIITGGVITIVFSYILNVNNNVDSNFLFYFTGVVVWNLFSNSTLKISLFFSSYHKLIKRLYIPVLIIPFSNALIGITTFVLQFIILIFFVILLSDQIINFEFILIIFPLIIIFISGFAVGLIFNSFTYKYNDIKQIIPYLLNMLLFLSPVMYSYESFPEKYKFLFLYNPIFTSIEYFRCIILNLNVGFEIKYLIIGFSISVFLLLIGLFRTAKSERYYIDFL